MKTGLLLLSGGSGTRMGAPKHALAHPGGGSWGGHLVRVFAAVFPDGPVQVLGDPLPDHPDLPRLEDPREGPAVALRVWARADGPDVDRWWVAACDQVRWTPQRLTEWARIGEAADPEATHWVMALHGGHLQPLGGWLPDGFRPSLITSTTRSLMGLATALPHLAIPCDGPEWVDVDTPEERAEFEGGA
ncbi:MAG: NTP transferase domain-containing protein [Geothrix sp.]|uniref:NTP transferase domain-containing protein n=1 Tax=Geothrix sp. TaxID=1962974 RepID=UPI00185C345B|nr:NTP transferase domain-containing protein [Geothrix sp.]NWJ42044.1 NTP transferase domain-containing protein [Geothrix sp.]WIL19988.1 MAG: NTP transferase domain-containing protein [Geothrix sp.]